MSNLTEQERAIADKVWETFITECNREQISATTDIGMVSRIDLANHISAIFESQAAALGLILLYRNHRQEK